MLCSHCKLEFSGQAWVVGKDVLHEACYRPWQRAREGLTFKCPQCQTTGKVDDETRPRYENVPNMSCYGPSDPLTVREQVGFEKKWCPLCRGEGYLAKEPKPITKVVGWTT